MSVEGSEPGARGTFGRLRAVVQSIVRGERDGRVRATWRVLLAMPVLWILTGGVLTGNVQSAVGAIPSGGGPAAGLAQSLLHGGFFLVALAAWARHLDRRPLSEYGVSITPRWFLHLGAGFVAVVAGFGAWLAVGSVFGTTAVAVSASSSGGSLLAVLAILAVALVLHAAVQQVVFFRVVLGTAAGGLERRGVAPRRAAVGGVLVAIPFFVAMHGLPTGLRVLDLVVAGGVFGLLYVHTGELAVGIGAHFGGLYAGSVLFVPAQAAGGSAVLTVSGSLPGLLGVVNRYGFPKMVVAYLLVVAWLAWRRGEVSVRSDVARRTEG